MTAWVSRPSSVLQREARRTQHEQRNIGSDPCYYRPLSLFSAVAVRCSKVRCLLHTLRLFVPDVLEIDPELVTSPVAAELIGELNAELTGVYPEPGATHFRLDADEVAPGHGVFLVIRWNGRPIGCGAVRRLREPDLVRELGPDVGELKRMYVAREMRGRGIGRALLERLETEARALGLVRLVLETGTRQAEALALYRRAGFTDIPPYGEYRASPATSVCLAKEL